jgi:hypothetical protein
MGEWREDWVFIYGSGNDRYSRNYFVARKIIHQERNL